MVCIETAYIAGQPLLECACPFRRGSKPAFPLLCRARPGAALACPYSQRIVSASDDTGPNRAPGLGVAVFDKGACGLEIQERNREATANHVVLPGGWAIEIALSRWNAHPFSGYTFMPKQRRKMKGPVRRAFLHFTWMRDEANFREDPGRE